MFFTAIQFAQAADVWSVGTEDMDYGEFAIAGNYRLFTEKFPNDPVVDVDCVNTKIEWPFIQPGPIDIWSTRKPHTFTIKFDLPKTVDAEPPIAYELAISGWGQPGSPPTLKIKLNDSTNSIQTANDAKSDRLLTNPKAAAPGKYSVAFPASVIKEKGNTLEITTESGSWFIYDCVKFKTKTGKIETINVKPVRGVFKGKGNELARKVKIEYDGEFLNKSAALTLTEAGGEITEMKLDPNEHFNGAEVLVPVADCTKPLNMTAIVEIDGRKIVSKETTIPGERKWEIHLIHQTHLDIGYTHTQVDVLEQQVQSLKDALKYIEETKDYPPEARFKFHPEGMWAVDEFFRTASDEEKEAFIKAAKDRDIHLDVLYAQAMTGMYSNEELFELMGSALRFGREHGIEIDSAMQTDVPGYTWGLVPVLAKCGVKYMTMGPNAGHRVGRLYYWGEKPFWWESPSGKERILCYLADTGYHQFHGKPVGHRLTAEEIFTILDGKDWLAHSTTPRTFPFDLVPLRYGIEGDNGRPNRVLSDVVKEWNETYVYPKLIISRNSDYMKELEKRHGKELPVVRGDYTPYWEDGAASTSEATAINRRSKSILPILEMNFASRPNEYRKKLDVFDSIWTDIIMYDEHTWGAFNSISAPDSDFVKQQDDYKQEYAKRASRNITESIIGDFNFADDFASEMKSDFGKPYVDEEKGIIGNDVLTVQIDKKTGAIISLKRKGIDADLVNPGGDGNSGLNDYLCIIGRNADENRSKIEGDLKITFSVINEGGTASIRIESAAPNCETLTRIITVSQKLDAVCITNVMDKKMERRPEGIFFGFPFNVPGGVWRVDTPWAMVQVEKDQLPGANRNYYCVQWFCNLSNDEYGIEWLPLDAPLVQFAPVAFVPAWDNTLQHWREHIEPNGTIYSWVCNNHWETNYKAGQDGRLEFSYAIKPYIGKYDAAKSQRLVYEDPFRNTIQKKIVNKDNDNVFITRLKPTREESGLILRLYNPTDKPQTVSLDFVKKIKQLYYSNMLEDRLEKTSNTLTIDPLDFITLRAE